MKTLKIIKWRDSNRYFDQTELQDFKVAIIESSGFLIQEDEKKMVLAQDKIGDEFRGVIVIPMENIIDMETFDIKPKINI